MSKIIGDAACPSCREQGKDKTGNHLMLFSDGGGFCNRCGYSHKATDGEIKVNPVRTKSPEEIHEEIEDAKQCPISQIPSRAIETAAAERFEFRVGVSQSDGVTPLNALFPRHVDGHLVGFKVKGLNKKMFYHVGSCKGSDLVGLKQALNSDTSKQTLWVAEDDLSMASIYQSLQMYTKPEYMGIKPAVVCLPDGSDEQGSKVAHLFDRHKEDLKKFQEINMVLDNDEAGRAGAEMAYKLFPDRVKVVELPMKDPNDMLMAKRAYELSNAVRFGAHVKTLARAVSAVDLIEASLEPPKEGLSFPWQSLTDMTIGQRDHEMTTIGGASGGGKTSIAYEIALHNILKYGRKIGGFLLEEQTVKALRHITSRHADHNFNDPRQVFQKELYLEKVNEIAPYIELWDNKGENDWDNILETMRFWHNDKGVTTFFIDNVTAMTSHLSPTEINTTIGTIAKDVSQFVNAYPVHVFVFSHLNPSKGKLTHEEGAEAKAAELTGSRHLQRYSQNIFMFERNLHADGDMKNVGKIRLVKCRETGDTGWFQTHYTASTTRLVEIPKMTSAEQPTTPIPEVDPNAPPTNSEMFI